MKTYTCQKGKHRFTSGPLGVPCLGRVRRASWEVAFSPSCRYNLPGADQDDWNKGGGVSFDLLTNHTDSVMWAWRYNPGTDKIELGLYCHVDGRREIAIDVRGRQALLSVAIGEIVTVELEVEDSAYAMRFDCLSSETVTAAIPFTHRKKTIRTINPWFGGNNPAPHTMNLYLHRKFAM